MAPTNLQVRPLQASDAPAYRQLALEGYERAADAFTSTVAERAAQPIAWWVSRIGGPTDAGGQAFGAFVAGQLIGSVAVEYASRAKTRHKGHVVGMYVDAAYRALGAGRALMVAVMADAQSRNGIVLLTLTVTEGNAAAIGLYESMGFKTFGVEPLAICVGANYLAKVHMAWVLPRAAASEAQA